MATKLEVDKENKLLKDQIRELRKIVDDLQEKQQVIEQENVDLPEESFTFYRNSDRETIIVRVEFNPENGFIMMKESKNLGKSTDTANHKLRQSVLYKLMGSKNWKNGNVRGSLNVEE